MRYIKHFLFWAQKIIMVILSLALGFWKNHM